MSDPSEHVDLASTLNETFAALLAEFYSYNTSYHPPVENPPFETARFCDQVCGLYVFFSRGGVFNSASLVQVAANGGVVGPWRPDPLERQH